MIYEITNISKVKDFRVYVTIVEKNDNETLTGYKATIPFDVKKKDFAGLKKRFEAEFKRLHEEGHSGLDLLTELRNAEIENLSTK